MDGRLRMSIKTPQADNGFWNFLSPKLLMLSLNKDWERGAAVYTGVYNSFCRAVLCTNIFPTVEGDLCMYLLNGFNLPRSKHTVIHSDKTASIRHVDKRVDKWLDRQLLSRQLQLASSTELPKMPINWDDVRIRQLSPNEQAGNTKYWLLRMQVAATRSVVSISRNCALPLRSFRSKH